MAKHTIQRRCGHDEDVQIYGPHKDRPRQAEYEAGKLCYDCYKAEQQRQRDEDAAKAMEQAEAEGLAELTGSEKQVAWALRIRAKIVEDLRPLVERAHGTKPEAAPQDEWEANVAKFDWAYKWLLSQSQAAWWIDKARSLSGREALAYFVAKIDARESGADLAEAVRS